MNISKKSALIVLVLSLLGLAIFSYSLYSRVNEVWGYSTLGWFVTLWLSINASIHLVSERKRDSFNYFALSTLSGVLLAVGFSPLPLAFTLFLGFAPLLWIIYKFRDRSSFYYTFNALILWNLLATFWVANSTLLGGVFAIVANSLLMCIPLFVYKLSSKQLNTTFSFLAFMSTWILWEFFHLNWEISWPWLTLGNGFSSMPFIIQWYSYTGVMGGTLWVIIVNWIVFQWAKNYYDNGVFEMKTLMKAGFIIIIPALISAVQYYSFDPQGEKIQVVAIQPNYEPHFEKFSIHSSDQILRFAELSESAVDDQTDYLIFPETSFGRIKEENGTVSTSVIKYWQAFLQKYPDLVLETGIDSHRILDEGEPHSKFTRESKRSGKIMYWENHNACIEIESGAPIELYHKGKMVPGTESFPYANYLSFMGPLVKNMGGTTAGLAVSKERKVFTAQKTGVKMAPMICYESIYGDYGRDYILKGAQFVAVETNDGWWGDTPGYKQHLNFSRLRAIEYRRDVVRSANTGSSAFINARGDIVSSTNYGVEAALKGEMTLRNEVTFYVKYGEFISRLSIFFFILVLLKLSSDLTQKVINKQD